MRRRAFMPITTRYVPVDEFLMRPRTRIILALRHTGWISGQALNDHLNLPSIEEDANARNAYTQTVARLVKEGLVRRRRIEPTGHHATMGGVYLYDLVPNLDLTIPAPTLSAPRWRERKVSVKPNRKTRLVRLAMERYAS